MKFYRIDLSKMYFSSKKSYAYLSVNSDNSSDTPFKEEKVENYIYKCPYCGYERIDYFYPKKQVGVFNKNNVGDFAFGVPGYGQCAVSEKVINMMEKYELIGIEDYKMFNFCETTRKMPIDLKSGNMYDIKIKHLPLIWAKCVDENLDSFSGTLAYKNDEDIGCDYCAGKFSYLSLSKKAQVYIKNLNDVNLDIFTTMSNPSYIFVSEKFANACISENITNITEKLIPVFDFNEIAEK